MDVDGVFVCGELSGHPPADGVLVSHQLEGAPITPHTHFVTVF